MAAVNREWNGTGRDTESQGKYYTINHSSPFEQVNTASLNFLCCLSFGCVLAVQTEPA